MLMDSSKAEKSLPYTFCTLESVDILLCDAPLPDSLAAEAEAGVDLVLSGHAHGGQFIPIGLISSLFNDSCYGKTSLQQTVFLVTSGLGSWELKLKTGTVSEYVIIDLTKNP